VTAKAPPLTRDLDALAPPVTQGGTRRAASGRDSVGQSLARPARPLVPELRSAPDGHAAHDFGRVRVHASEAAAVGAGSGGAPTGPAVQHKADAGPTPKGATPPPAVEKSGQRDDEHKSRPAPKPVEAADPAPAKDDAHKPAPAPTLPTPQPDRRRPSNSHPLTMPGTLTPPHAGPTASDGRPLRLPPWLFEPAPKESPDAWFARDLSRSPLIDALGDPARKWILDWARDVKFHPPDSPGSTGLPPREEKQPGFDKLRGQHLYSSPTFHWDFPWGTKEGGN
jgi:hypothetical protein